MRSATKADPPGAFAPFGVRAFAVLWAATVLSNIGTWMMSTGSAWLMTGLSPSPLMVSAVQAASSAPIFLFALLAGALSDIFDRRALLLTCQVLAASAACSFAALVALEAVSATTLLIFTFVMATGAAFVAPSWQAIVPQLVPRPMIGQAIALNSMGINVARAIGPALAGLLIMTVGIVAPFAADALSYLFIVAALWWWRPGQSKRSASRREALPGAVAGGLRFAANSSELKAALMRAAGFFLFASAPMSLLPVIARSELGGDASAYGMLMAAIGAGAVSGALVLPRLKGMSQSARLMAGSVFASLAGCALGFVPSLLLAMGACFGFGLGWIMVLATLNTAAQMALPDWVRARGLALFTMVFSGAMTVGSLVWGVFAQTQGTPMALLFAGVGGVATAVLLSRLRLADGTIDLSPSSHWPDPVLAGDDGREKGDGPVLVTIEYRVDAANRSALMSALNALAPARKRNGATWWAAFEDVTDPGRIVELFTEQSWDSHIRHHERVTAQDATLQAAVQALLADGQSGLVTHWRTPHDT